MSTGKLVISEMCLEVDEVERKMSSSCELTLGYSAITTLKHYRRKESSCDERIRCTKNKIYILMSPQEWNLSGIKNT